MQRFLILCVISVSIVLAVCYTSYSETPFKTDWNEKFVGRYQLLPVVVKDGLVLCRIDTLTGKVWIYNPRTYNLLTEKQFKELRVDKWGMFSDYKSYLESMEKVLLEGGTLIYVPPHWEEIPETPSGFSITTFEPRR
ncbi:MAG: hypothetical protein DRG40_05995 [Deltaproteobacteria bacterium]|nr:MAG: hypothetical protein DRG40_05995 [Deltaproteobacteria bacterium]